MPDLQYTISNEVYKEYKVLWTPALLGSGCYSAQLAELFLLSRAFSNISYIHFESNCASASKHHLYHCIRGCNVLWWICKSAWLCPLLLLPLNLWMKSSFCYERRFRGKKSEHTEFSKRTVRRHWRDLREWKGNRSGLHKASEPYGRGVSLLNSVYLQKHIV